MSKAAVLLVILLAAFFLLSSDIVSPPDQFQTWKQTHSASFSDPADEFYRRSIFMSNLANIEQHNSDPSSTYRMETNQFTIYTQQEFAQRYLVSNMRQPVADVELAEKVQLADTVKEVIIDWAAKGAVGPVRNQGVCGSGVLYGTLGEVQGLGKVVTGTFKSFSAQQLKDCVFGCTGSMINAAYNYYKSHSVCNEVEYPEGGQPAQCLDKRCTFTISGYKQVKDCDSLVNALHKQPIAVTVDASRWSAYSSGIFNNCGTSLNHMVLLTALADEYWKCKNSWGTSWGEQGYIRLARGNTCGICSYGSYAIV